MLAPAVTLADLWPPEAVIVQRPPDDALDWLPREPAWRERSSAAPLPMAGALPIVCHEAGVTSAGLALLRECGLSLPGEIIPYRTFAEMRQLVAEQVGRGRKVGITFTGRESLAPAEAHVNDPGLVAYLNDKANLPELLPPAAFPERRVIDARDLARELHPDRRRPPFVLKASSRLGNGGGTDVAICRTPEDVGPACRALGAARRLILEEYVEFAATWCLSFAVGQREVTYLGAAEQVCDERGAYRGNWCGRSEPPDRAVAYGRHAALAGQALGYRGFFGVDAGRTRGGSVYAFDLNYRNNGSTAQVLLRDSLARAWDAPVTRNCLGIGFHGSYAGMLDRIRWFAARREVLPLLTFDTERLGPPGARPCCNLLLAGRSAEAVAAVGAGLRRAGFEIALVPGDRAA